MKKRILIIEDEIMVAMQLDQMLKELGYLPIKIIDNADEAIDYLSFHTPDLVLCDISIKGSADGIAVAEKINLIKKIPFVYLTSFADNYTIDRASKTLPYGYVVKPYGKADLRSSIEVALTKFKAESDQQRMSLEKMESLTTVPLTIKEFEIVQLIVEGESYESIQAIQDISNNTLKTHLKHINQKFCVENRSALLQKILTVYTNTKTNL